MENNHSKNHQTRGTKLMQHKRVRINTFSQRKAEIVKKASELCTFPGTEVGVFIFSSTGKPYSFAHPSIESVINRYHDEHPSRNDITTNLGEAEYQETIRELNQKYDEVLKQLKAEKAKKLLLDYMEKEGISTGGLMKPINQLSLEELQQLDIQIQQLQKHVSEREARNEPASSSTIATANPSYAINPFTDGKTK